MNMAEWLTDIGDCLRFQSLICWVSVSYLMTNTDGDKNIMTPNLGRSPW